MLLALQQNLLLGDVTLVEVPDVVGQTQGDGTTTLEAAGFAVAVQTAFSSVVAAGTIISQDPAGGIEYPEGGTVTIVVSLGEAPASTEFDVTVPYLIGDTQEMALARIAAIYCIPSVTGTSGTVTAQSPDAFSLVNRGTTISITLGGEENNPPRGRFGQIPYGSGIQ